MNLTTLVTAESVRRGHPDKMADQVADAILRNILVNASALEKRQRSTRVACEVAFWNGNEMDIGGEVTTRVQYDPDRMAREVIRDIGWVDETMGLSFDKIKITNKIKPQSGDIAQGVDSKKGIYKSAPKIGAGDQGIMVGYATNETKELMPAAIMYAHKLVRRVDDLMKKEGIFLWPDGKAQVTLVRDAKTYKPLKADSVVVSVQHNPTITHEEISMLVKECVIKPELADLIDGSTKIFVNPTGRFVKGGPASDTGFTGRKLVVDAYGPEVPVGGGAFSGKDPTKVDRSAAYAARYMAKNIVAAGLADRCKVSMAYAIGIAEPVEVTVDMLGTGKLDGKYLQGKRLTEFEQALGRLAREMFPLEPGKIIRAFDLTNFDYRIVSCYGHFGRQGLPWERIDKAQNLVKAVEHYLKK